MESCAQKLSTSWTVLRTKVGTKIQIKPYGLSTPKTLSSSQLTKLTNVIICNSYDNKFTYHITRQV